jgi:adenosylcobyric acid synthase
MIGRARALMILGTASHVGKSTVAAAFCRLLAEEGFRVAPFKAQNMALNSFVTLEGGEIGRAQVAQAEACGIEPHVDMNPILLKPMGGVSQVVVEGSPIGLMSAREYYAAKDQLWPRVAAAYDRLAIQFDRVVLEGAGSPVEINLTEHDLTNLKMARHADASVVLVADIERGGVFAQIVGTWELMEPLDRARVVGFIINKFRGDASLLDSGLAYLRERTGVPVLGVLPYRGDLQIDQEDSLGIDETASPSESDDDPDALDIVVARLPGLSNFTDVWPLARVPGVRVRYVERGDELGLPDLVVLPGTKTTVRDLHWLHQMGLADRIVRLAENPEGPVILGICGGFQMLGNRIDDPLGVESAERSAPGLGLLDVATTFAPSKERHRVAGATLDGNLPIAGYEIHMGSTERGPGVPPWTRLTRQRDGEILLDGASSPSGRIFGTYVHGLFDSLPFCRDLVDRLRARRGQPPLDPVRWEAHRRSMADRYGPLAKLLRDHLDLETVRLALKRND